MGTLTDFLGSDKETIAKSLNPGVVDYLKGNTAAGSVAGIDVGQFIPLPTPEIASIAADSLEQSTSEEPDTLSNAYASTIMAIDEGLPPGVKTPPVFDPTFFVPVEQFVEFLVSLGIQKPLEWITTNLPKLLTPEFGEGMKKLSTCDHEGFSEAMTNVDGSINAGKAAEASEKICGFELKIEIPKFGIVLPDFTLDVLPIEFGLEPFNLIPDFDFPQVHFAGMFILEAIINGVLKLLEGVAKLIAAIIEGITAFILYVAEFLINFIAVAIITVLKPLLNGIVFAAQCIVFIAKVVGAVIVALIGHLIGNGLICVTVAEKLGVAQ